jgi:ABC-type polysaccharide/polyol phosphate transport system ATPase subunit
MCDRVIWLNKGKIKMIGEAEEVCNAFIESV